MKIQERWHNVKSTDDVLDNIEDLIDWLREAENLVAERRESAVGLFQDIWMTAKLCWDYMDEETANENSAWR